MTATFPKDALIATMRCRPDAPLPCKLDWPISRVCYWGAQPGDVRPHGESTWQDPWGVTWRKESPDPSMMPFPVAHPLEEGLGNLDGCSWPEPDAPQRFLDLMNLQPTAERLLTAEHPFALYERAWLLAGMQNLLTAMAEYPERVDALFDRIGAFELAIARRYVRLGVEAAWIADDYGMSSGLMFSPPMWRRFVKPHLKRLVDCYHEAGTLVIVHSCGNITPLIDEFLALGIDVLDPLQPDCNRLDVIRRRTTGRMCLCGGVAASALLAEELNRTILDTRERIEHLGAGGGYIVGPDDECDFPERSRDAMLRTVEEYRGSESDRS